jgi:leucyl aminopeptidase
MKNSGSRYGGASSAACFLSKFVENKNWAHIDIAGTAFVSKSAKEMLKGAAGAGVRTLIEYILK